MNDSNSLNITDLDTADLWDGFLGAERWPGDCNDPSTAPLYRELTYDAFIIADRTNVEVFIWDDESDDYSSWIAGINFPNQACALVFMENFPAEITELKLTQLGFECII